MALGSGRVGRRVSGWGNFYNNRNGQMDYPTGAPKKQMLEKEDKEANADWSALKSVWVFEKRNP